MVNGEVVARAGEHANKQEYVVSLSLDSDCSQHPTSPMGRCFVELLQAHRGPYHTLAEAAHALDNLATFAEVKQYHCHHKQHSKLKADQCAIITEIESKDEQLDGICHCMEA